MMTNLFNPDQKKRQELVNAARIFAPLLAKPDLSEDEIDTIIEELRSVRMHIHAIDYGEAPGFRYQQKEVPHVPTNYDPSQRSDPLPQN